jgi:general stress protein 26
MTDDSTRRVAELLDGQRLGFLTTTTPDGKLTSRPMALQEVEFDGDLWFFAERDAPWVAALATSPQVNVGVGSGGSLWNGAVEAWLPQGAEDSSVVLVRVDADSAEYWDAPGGRLATAFSFLKAKATGQRIDAGENAKVDL